MANNKILFKHFYNTEEKWKSLIDSSAYDSAIIFGLINHEGADPSYLIYAGKDVKGRQYVYDVASATELISLKDKLKELANLINIMPDSSFTNSSFIAALDNYINLNQAIKDIDTSIVRIEGTVDGLTNEIAVIEFDIDTIDNSINIINTSINNLDSSVAVHDDSLTWVLLEVNLLEK